MCNMATRASSSIGSISEISDVKRPALKKRVVGLVVRKGEAVCRDPSFLDPSSFCPRPYTPYSEVPG